MIIVHSQGGNFGFNAALAAPDTVKALIAIEPTGAPEPTAAGGGALKAVPHLVVWGDHIGQSDLWMRLLPASQRYVDALRAEGGVGRLVGAARARRRREQPHADDGPQLGPDRRMIQTWLAEKGLMR